MQHLYARALASRSRTTALLAAIQDVNGAAVAGEKSIDRTVETVYDGACGARLQVTAGVNRGRCEQRRNHADRIQVMTED